MKWNPECIWEKLFLGFHPGYETDITDKEVIYALWLY